MNPRKVGEQPSGNLRKLACWSEDEWNMPDLNQHLKNAVHICLPFIRYLCLVQVRITIRAAKYICRHHVYGERGRERVQVQNLSCTNPS